jgi:predicted Zn finger-like uncharacterized protein
MAKFLTQCPFCQTSFKVSAEQMQAANGVVRCGACMEVFLAGQNRITLREKPEDDIGAASDTDSSESPHIEEISEETHDLSSEESTSLFTAPLTTEETVEPEDSIENSDAEIIASFDKNFQDDALEDTADELSAQDYLDADLQDQGLPENDLPEDASHPDEEHAESEESTPLTSWENFDDSDADVEEINTEVSEQDDESQNLADISEKSEAPTKEQAEFSTFLNPYAYSVQEFSMNCDLPDEFRNSANEGDIPESEPEKRETEEDIPIQQLTEEPEEASDKPEEPSEAKNTAPALSPDLVAQENIPVLTENQPLDWLQSLRHATPHFQQNPVEKTSINIAVDEKAIIHSNLSALSDEDSLGPLAPENLEAIDDQPVELLKLFDPLKTLKKVALVLLGIMLFITLAGQYLWLNLSEISRDERFDLISRPLCNFADCPDRTRVDLSALITEELIIRSHPDIEDALQVDFIFRNDADREQRFPLIELNFTNSNGNIIANRVFTPEEYLPPEMHLFTHMPAHSSLQVNLELVDPGEDSTGYSLVFRNP